MTSELALPQVRQHATLDLFVVAAHRISVIAVLAAGACEPNVCPDGIYGGIVQVLADRLRLEALPASQNEFPFSEPSPLLECTEVGAILLAGGPGDDRFYPALHKVGSIGPDILAFDRSSPEPHVPSIDGFDSVTALGGIGGSVGVISGFNSVTYARAVTASADITGMRSLEETEILAGGIGGVTGLQALRRVGTLEFTSAGMEDGALPALEEVESDLKIEQTHIGAFAFPQLHHVGGSVRVFLNDRLSQWIGFALGARIDGDFIVTNNFPITTDEVLAAMESGEVRVRGELRVCENGNPRAPACPAPQP